MSKGKKNGERKTNQETDTLENKLLIIRGQVGRDMGETGDGIKEYTYHDEKNKTNKKYINILEVHYHSYFCHLLFPSCLLPSICDIC